MHYCDYCQKGFKSIQGLLGHQRMAHGAGHNVAVQAAGTDGTAVFSERLGRIEAALERIERFGTGCAWDDADWQKNRAP